MVARIVHTSIPLHFSVGDAVSDNVVDKPATVALHAQHTPAAGGTDTSALFDGHLRGYIPI